MLQVSFGGYRVVSTNDMEYYDNSIYYEPGFTTLAPLEFEVPQADILYILIKKRTDDTGVLFDSVSYEDLNITATDVTIQEELESTINVNDIYTGWDEDASADIPLLAQIYTAPDMVDTDINIRTIDCFIEDTTDNDFISFRILVNEENRFFYYIPIEVKNLSDRYKFTAVGREAYVRTNSSTDSYVLFSPYAYLKETTSDQADFSYPLNTIYYKRQDTYNKEDFDFSISSYSHTFVADNISLINVPGDKQVAVLHIDANMNTEISNLGSTVYVNILITGKMSGITNTFTINLR